MLRAETSWNGEIDEMVVEDTDGGVWTPDISTQAEIQASENKADVAVAICESQPTRGVWAT